MRFWATCRPNMLSSIGSLLRCWEFPSVRFCLTVVVAFRSVAKVVLLSFSPTSLLFLLASEFRLCEVFFIVLIYMWSGQITFACSRCKSLCCFLRALFFFVLEPQLWAEGLLALQFGNFFSQLFTVLWVLSGTLIWYGSFGGSGDGAWGVPSGWFQVDPVPLTRMQ